jgi:hypothetical protein
LWGPPSRAFCTTASASGTEPCSSYFWTSSWWVTLLLVARHQHVLLTLCQHGRPSTGHDPEPAAPTPRPQSADRGCWRPVSGWSDSRMEKTT